MLKRKQLIIVYNIDAIIEFLLIKVIGGNQLMLLWVKCSNYISILNWREFPLFLQNDWLFNLEMEE